MKNGVSLASTSGLTLIELLLASAVSIAISAAGYRVFSGMQKSTAAESNHTSAKMVASSATKAIRTIFAGSDHTALINDDPTSFSVTFGSGANSTVVRNTCISAPTASELSPPPATALPKCPQLCATGKVPQIYILYPDGRESYFPASYAGLHGAILCAQALPESRGVKSYSVAVYVGWSTFKSGTPHRSLWSVDGAFLVASDLLNSTKAVVVP
jgi:hypothetical protein